VKQAAPLRGYAAFDRVFKSGQRIGGTHVMCMYQLERAEKPVLLVGYAVSSRQFNAVRRNRVRRLMREATRLECAQLCSALTRHSVTAELILLFRTRPGSDVRRLTLAPMQRDVAGLFGRLAQRLAEAAHA
jgi:ribonuclease P protein component